MSARATTPNLPVKRALLSASKASGQAARVAAAQCARTLAGRFEDGWRRALLYQDPGLVDVIDFFSGCGGMSAGFLAVNSLFPAFKIRLAVDIDPDANATYEINLGLRPLCVSVAEIAKNPQVIDDLVDSFRNRRRPLVMIGCAPCQGFSSHRTDGDKDERNSLFVDFARIAAHVLPDAIIIENVPEILTDQHYRHVQEARELLYNSGYFTYLGVHNMADFGVPQERFRAVMLGFRHGFALPQPLFRAHERRTVRHAIAHLPAIAPGAAHSEDPMHVTASHRESTIETIKSVPKDGGSRPPHVGPECLRRGRERQGRGMYDDVYGRLYWDRPAITITHYSRNPASGRFIHPDQDRGLSIREAALLQGFPSSYAFHGSLDDAFRQIGNAVPPRFAAYLGCYVLGELASTPTDALRHQGLDCAIGSSFSRLIPSLKASSRLGFFGTMTK